MLRRRCFVCVIASVGTMALVLAGCFGRVEYGPEPLAASGGVATAAGGVVHGTGGAFPNDGSGGAREPLARVSGGATGSGGASSKPACAADCCGAALAQVTFASDGQPLDADAERPYLSGDGKWVVFGSRATNLAGSVGTGIQQIYVHDLGDDALLSILLPGVVPNGDSQANAISEAAEFVLFTSSATNWGAADDNGAPDVFLFERSTGTVTLVSRGPLAWAGNAASLGRDLSPDGRFVVYSSAASDLVPADDNASWDVFVWDRELGTTQRLSMGPGDQQRNPVPGNHAHVSADGRHVSFHSQSDELLHGGPSGTFDVFLVDRQTSQLTRVSQSGAGVVADGNTFVLGMSDDARFLASYGSSQNLVSGDTNEQSDVFFFDRLLGTVERVNVGANGQQAEIGTTNVSLSHDGRFLGFASASARLGAGAGGTTSQAYLYDAVQRRTAPISQNRRGEPGDASSSPPELSRSGRCLAFSSRAANLTSESTDDDVADVFVGPRSLD